MRHAWPRAPLPPQVPQEGPDEVPDLRRLVVETGEAPDLVTAFGPSLSIHPLPGPGPFVLNYRLAGGGPWQMEVFDIRGRRMLAHELPATEEETGEFRWDGRSPDGSPVSAGVYWVRLRGAVGSVTERMVVVR